MMTATATVTYHEGLSEQYWTGSREDVDGMVEAIELQIVAGICKRGIKSVEIEVHDAPSVLVRALHWSVLARHGAPELLITSYGAIVSGPVMHGGWQVKIHTPRDAMDERVDQVLDHHWPSDMRPTFCRCGRAFDEVSALRAHVVEMLLKVVL